MAPAQVITNIKERRKVLVPRHNFMDLLKDNIKPDKELKQKRELLAYYTFNVPEQLPSPDNSYAVQHSLIIRPNSGKILDVSFKADFALERQREGMSLYDPMKTLEILVAQIYKLRKKMIDGGFDPKVYSSGREIIFDGLEAHLPVCNDLALIQLGPALEEMREKDLLKEDYVIIGPYGLEYLQ